MKSASITNCNMLNRTSGCRRNKIMKMNSVFTTTESLDTVFNTLKFCLEKAHVLINRNKVDHLQYAELAEYTCQIRLLLKELHHVAGPFTDKKTTAIIHELRDRYTELEGIVKERRNDLTE